MKSLTHIATLLVLLGSFLPWEQSGDLVSYHMYGISLFPFMEDNGGTITLLLALATWVLIFRPPGFIANPGPWALMTSVLLVGSSFFFVARWLVGRFEAAGIIGAPMIQIGLIGIIIGALLLLFGTIYAVTRSTSTRRMPLA